MHEVIGRDPAVFEHNVRQLLRLAGFTVSEETLIGHKKVDAYAEYATIAELRRVAVECKAIKGHLTQADASAIYANYLPLYQANLIDEILVVTLDGLTPTATAMVAATRELSHLSFHELQNRVIDFRSYLGHIAQSDNVDGRASYYVRPKTTTSGDLEDEIVTWLKGSDARPVALLAGYGMGKTTFATHLAASLARIAQTDSTARVPILVPLGEISSNQDLAGLLGKLFTHVYNVRNYRYDSFLQLNRMGRFLVICDGFDEMKHTLSWEEFRFNLREINQLVTRNARVVISGRPTAFINQAEQQFALHGLTDLQGASWRDQEWPDYREIELAPFDEWQVRAFLDGYQKWLIDRQRSVGAGSARAVRAAFAAKRSKRVMKAFESTSGQGHDGQLADLLTRPVHLKMLIEI